jgi:pimeloyl-ACP methyl ester carboxylesterase
MPAHHPDLLYHETHLAHPDADWLVLIHGAGGSTVTWKRQVPSLGTHYNLLLMDLPGHGRMAERPNLEEFYTFERIGERIWDVIDHLGLSRVHLVGVSLGTVIALAMREQRPQHVVTLVNGGAILRLSKRLLREGQHMRLESLLELSAGFQALAHKTPQHVEAVNAFVERRKPVFGDD